MVTLAQYALALSLLSLSLTAYRVGSTPQRQLPQSKCINALIKSLIALHIASLTLCAAHSTVRTIFDELAFACIGYLHHKNLAATPSAAWFWALCLLVRSHMIMLLGWRNLSMALSDGLFAILEIVMLIYILAQSSTSAPYRLIAPEDHSKELQAEKGLFYDISRPLPLKAYATHSIEEWNEFKVIDFEPKRMEDYDVEIAVKYCGVCASDVYTRESDGYHLLLAIQHGYHSITGGWSKDIILPMITGHEIAGIVHRVGPKCTEFKVGDRVGVGAAAMSCLECDRCQNDNEQYCKEGVSTYNARYKNGDIAQGGYSTCIRIHERFVFPIPDSLPLIQAASMMCGGLTTYSPLKRYGCGPGKRVAVVGLGGLGHYAVQWAVALGADEVVVISHTDGKAEDAFKMGATKFVATSKLKGGLRSSGLQDLDLILSTVDVASAIPLGDLLFLTKVGGAVLNVGLPDGPVAVSLDDFARNATNFVTTNIGSKKEAIEMLNLAVEKNVRTWVNEYPMKDCGLAVSQLHGDVPGASVRYRQVLKMDLL